MKTVARFVVSAMAYSTFMPLASPQAVSELSLESQESPQPNRTESHLGSFLREEIAKRLERVSGRRWSLSESTQFTEELSTAIAEGAYEQNIDPFLLLAMVEVESRYDKMAVGRHGERGLLQIKPSTAAWITENQNCDLHDPSCNLKAGSAYLNYLSRRTRDRQSAVEPTSEADIALHTLRSYNEGPARADRLRLEAPMPVPYAVKIAGRAARFRARFLDQVLNRDGRVTEVAQNH